MELSSKTKSSAVLIFTPDGRLIIKEYSNIGPNSRNFRFLNPIFTIYPESEKVYHIIESIDYTYNIRIHTKEQNVTKIPVNPPIIGISSLFMIINTKKVQIKDRIGNTSLKYHAICYEDYIKYIENECKNKANGRIQKTLTLLSTLQIFNNVFCFTKRELQ